MILQLLRTSDTSEINQYCLVGNKVLAVMINLSHVKSRTLWPRQELRKLMLKEYLDPALTDLKPAT